MGGGKYVSSRMMAASQAPRIPDPLLGGGTQGKLVDSDRNGKPDLAMVRGTFSRGILIDADEARLGALQPDQPADEIVKSRQAHPEVSVIIQGNVVWAIYDTDNDHKFDLALMTNYGTDSSSLWATHAWRLGGGGEVTPAPEQIGRKLFRPGLVPLPRVATALGLLDSDLAKDEALGSLPDPLTSDGPFRSRELEKIPASTVVEAPGYKASVILVDVDHNTKLAPKANLQEIVAQGKFEAEIAVVHRRGDGVGSDWIYYDGDNDGKFELVLFVAVSGQDPTQAYRVTSTGLVADPTAVSGKPYRHQSVFQDRALAAKWKGIAGKLFKSSSIEP